MEKASKVMYTIANIFTWVIAVLAIFGIVFSALRVANVNLDVDMSRFNTGTLVYFIVLLLVSILTIVLVRIAKDDRTSKMWDVLFLIIGIIGGNIFYFLGGLFGLIADR